MTGKQNIIPKEIKKPVEEVRYLENEKQEQQQKPTITESVKEAVIPSVHASDDEDRKEKEKEGNKQLVGWATDIAGTVAPPVGGALAAGEIAVGSIVEGVGKVFGNEDVEETGEAWREAPFQPLKDAGKGIKKAFE